MFSFKNDYSEGAHPDILKALIDTNLEQTDGYGLDAHCERARELIREKLGSPYAEIHFLVGGTQANLLAISSFLRPHEAAICAHTGHINVHETGSVEATGHKVLTRFAADGKLTPALVQDVLEEHHGDEHMVKPKLVYISDSTEIGTIYTKAELKALYEFCQERDLILYLDGARLGSALCSEGNDLELSDFALYTDAFYIGGTKNGALFGEALVINRLALREDFRFLMKQKGAMLAKGKLLGIQFEELFRDNLYFALAQHANDMAKILREGIQQAGYSFFVDSPSNQIFPILKDDKIAELEKEFAFYVQGRVDEGHSYIRLVTSWATEESSVRKFLTYL